MTTQYYVNKGTSCTVRHYKDGVMYQINGYITKHHLFFEKAYDLNFGKNYEFRKGEWILMVDATNVRHLADFVLLGEPRIFGAMRFRLNGDFGSIELEFDEYKSYKGNYR